MAVEVAARRFTVDGTTIAAGDWITVDGATMMCTRSFAAFDAFTTII